MNSQRGRDQELPLRSNGTHPQFEIWNIHELQSLATKMCGNFAVILPRTSSLPLNFFITFPSFHARRQEEMLKRMNLISNVFKDVNHV